MATTDARPGFKLPWSADRTESDANDAAEADSNDASVHDQSPVADAAADEARTPASEAVAVSDPEVAAPIDPVPARVDPWRLSAVVPDVEPALKRKPNKLMADLTRAMQAAAESAREESVTRLQTDAKAYIEGIHARSGSEAEELRHAADADVAGIRDWSKAEIARIREETDAKVATRKADLETEIDAHAARIERRIDRVQAHVTWFEAEMAGFFQKLLAEDDPTRLAAMAENLPEPPSFDDLADLPEPPAPVAAIVPAPVEQPDTSTDVEPTVDAEAAFAAIQATAEAALSDDRVETVEAPVIEGLSPEAAAEAEAEAEVNLAEDGDEIATFSDDALAARLAGLAPVDAEAPSHDLQTSRVIVTGLISVASIASFKRHLGRLDGVNAVGVSSGPDGEFIFAVAHGPAVDLAAAIPSLPGFAAVVTNASDDTVSVAARDPEIES